MSNVPSTTQTQFSTPASDQLASITNISSLTPDSLLFYCSNQLNDIDSQARAETQQQQQALQDRRAIQSAESVFKQFGTRGPQNQADWDKCENALQAAATSLRPDDPTRQQLLDYKSTMEHQYCNGIASNPHYPGDGEWQGNIDTLDKMAGAINSAAELQMIQLQSLVSQRATVVQLTTNMMSKMDQTTENIASKV